MAHVSWKSHANGALHAKAHLRKAVEIETILQAPMIDDPLGLFDCCGVSDGAACAIVTTPEIARSLGIDNPVPAKAIQLSASNRGEMGYGEWYGPSVRNTKVASTQPYANARPSEPPPDIAPTRRPH